MTNIKVMTLHGLTLEFFRDITGQRPIKNQEITNKSANVIV